MQPKKILIALCLLAVGLTTLGFANQTFTFSPEENSVEKDTKLYFYVNQRHQKSVSPSALSTAKSLSDIVEDFPVNWITAYETVEIHTTSNGRQKKAVGTSATLTAEQMEILRTADMATDVVVFVKHKTKNSITQEVTDEVINLKLQVQPDVRAQQPASIADITAYLQENTQDAIAGLETKMGFVAIAYFTIDEQGEAVDVEISEVEDYKGVERTIREVLEQMPRWTPAKDENGNAVQQKFEFVFGLGNQESGGC